MVGIVGPRGLVKVIVAFLGEAGLARSSRSYRLVAKGDYDGGLDILVQAVPVVGLPLRKLRLFVVPF